MRQQTIVRRLSFSGLPLFWKLLVPFSVLILIIGAAGTYVVVRDLSLTARVEMNQDLLRRSLDARSHIQGRELYLLESANFAANLRGMPEAVRSKNQNEAASLLGSVLALKTDLHFLAVTLPDGTSLVEFVREGSGAEAKQGAGTQWGAQDLVARSLPGKGDQKAAGFLTLGDKSLLAIVAPICSGLSSCESAGSAIVGIDAGKVVLGASGDAQVTTNPETRVALYSNTRELIASKGTLKPRTSAPLEEFVRQTEDIDGVELFTLYSPLELNGERVGTLAVSQPTEPQLQLARGSGWRLALVVFLGMAAAVTVGVLLSRYVLSHIQSLVETSRSLGKGDLSARVSDTAQDELGELAFVLNQMADELQASHENLERLVEERTSEVGRLLKERTDFFAGISHELRTPIAVIRNQAQRLLSSRSNVTRRSLESLQMIMQSADQLLIRVNDILDLARAESGRVDLSLSDVAIPDVLSALHPTIRGLASASRHSVDISVPDELPLVRADSNRLKDVVMNLIDNAIKYTPAGGKIAVSAAANNGKVQLSVTDSGPGIPKKVGDKIFEPFYRVPGIETQRGEASSGLGLALTKRLIEAQGGEIRFESKRGRGTTFTISLPSSLTKPSAGK